MRPFSLAVAISFVLGCAPPPLVVHSPVAPSDAPLEVRLHQPIGDVLHYSLSEPAYVAVFAVARGHGVRLLFPYFESQVTHRSHAGLNQETVHGGSRAWGFAGWLPSDQRYLQSTLAGNADAYFIIASKEPLPLEGILQSPYVLRSLLGDDAYRANDLSRTWDALTAALVAELPGDAWASDVYLTLRSPFAFGVAYAPDPTFLYCRDRRSFYATWVRWLDDCGTNQLMLASTPPVPGPALTSPLRKPPADPRDREPSVPVPPDGGIIATSRTRSDTFGRERATRASEANGIETSRADWKRGESGRAAEREVDAIRQRAPEPAPPPSRPAEARPQEQPSRGEAKRPAEPQRD